MNVTAATSAITPDLLAHLRSWEGRSESLHDTVTEASVRGLAATLDQSTSALPAPLPPLWHWLSFLPRAPQHELGEDGHPRLGGFLPPVPLPRRMWAGGRLHWHSELYVNEPLVRTSRVASVTHKAGRTGDLVFVTVRHEISRGRELAIEEEQDLVYRAAARPGEPLAAPQAAPANAAWTWDLTPDAVLLFRYSALTFNGHRIHYDRSHAVEREGHAGLVVHGPLIATLLLELVRRECPQARVRSFSFKAVRPSYDMKLLRICGTPTDDDETGARLWAQDGEGALAMQAEARFG